VGDDREYTKKLFDKFLAQFESSTDSENIHMIKGRAPEVISSFVAEHGVDLVVMGTIARTGLLGMLMGNTAETILDRIECSVLAVKPYNFKSPIRVD
jgi:nucleotide-binding universal stress UspA family protein